MEDVQFDDPQAALAIRPVIDIPVAEAARRNKTLRVGFDPGGPVFQRLCMSGQCPGVVQLSVLGSKGGAVDTNAFLMNPRREGAHFVCDCEFINYCRKKRVQAVVLRMDDEGGRKLAGMLLG